MRGTRVLGSTAILGAVDSALLMHRGGRFRTLSSRQRYGEDLEEITLDLDSATRNVTAGPPLADAEQAIAAQLILDFLAQGQPPDQARDRRGHHVPDPAAAGGPAGAGAPRRRSAV